MCDLKFKFWNFQTLQCKGYRDSGRLEWKQSVVGVLRYEKTGNLYVRLTWVILHHQRLTPLLHIVTDQHSESTSFLRISDFGDKRTATSHDYKDQLLVSLLSELSAPIIFTLKHKLPLNNPIRLKHSKLCRTSYDHNVKILWLYECNRYHFYSIIFLIKTNDWKNWVTLRRWERWRANPTYRVYWGEQCRNGCQSN